MKCSEFKKISFWVEPIGVIVALGVLVVMLFQTIELKKAQMLTNLISLNQQIYPCQKIDRIINDLNNGKNLFREKGRQYDQSEIDNFLGYFEMIGIIEKYKYLDLRIIKDMFGYDIEDIFKNEEIVKYINSDPRASWPYLKEINKKLQKLNRKTVPGK